MKTTMAILVVVGVVAASTARTQGNSYPIICAAGEGTDVTVSPSSSGTTITYRFRKGTSSGQSGVAPGTCAWMDRGLRSGEPAKLEMTFPRIWVRTYSKYVGPRTQHDVRFPIPQGGDPAHRQFLNVFLSSFANGSGTFTVHAYTDSNAGVLRVTRFGR